MVELQAQNLFDEDGQVDHDQVVEHVNRKLKKLLHTCLQECFSIVQDTKFRQQITELSSRARDEALDAFLARQHVVTSEFYVEIESRFYTSASVIARTKTSEHTQTNTLSTDTIELALTVDNIISRSESRHTESLAELELRLQELSYLAHPDFNSHCMHPQEFYPQFQNAIAPLNISTDGKILLCKLFYQQISPKLYDFYAQLNQFLMDMKILPSANSVSHATITESTLASEEIEHTDTLASTAVGLTTGQFFSPVDENILNQELSLGKEQFDQHTPQNLKEDPEFSTMDVYGPGQTGLDQNTIRLLLQPYNPDTASDSLPDQRCQFVRALSTVQQVEATSDAIFQADQIKTAVRRTLHDKGALDASEIVTNEENVIDFVSNIFQLILDDETLCDAIKALFAKLQISIIKLALIDLTFFQNPKHPARCLLNKLTSIGIGVTAKEELLFNKLKSVVDLIAENFETDTHIFELALDEIQKLDIHSLEREQKQKKVKKSKAKLKAKHSAAKRFVLHTFKKHLDERELPNQMLEFCLKCWSPHMAIIFMKQGKKSKDWRTSVRTLRKVIEVSQGTHSLHEIHQYIKQPNEFFNYIHDELEYLICKNQELDEIIETAGAWYATYLRDLQQEAKELNALTEKNHQETEHSDNVVRLFKDLSSPGESSPAPNTFIQEKPDFNFEKEIKPSHGSEFEAALDQDEMLDEIKFDDIYEKQTSDQSFAIEHNENEPMQANPIKQDASPIDITEKSETNTEDTQSRHEEDDAIENKEHEQEIKFTLDDMPESIVPGTWLEIYQGDTKAIRRLKFSATIEATNSLLFTDRSGDYSLKIDLQTFMHDFAAGRTRVINESNRFDLALSSVISTIRDGHSKSTNSG